jgi:hypothetical protein
MYNHLPLDAMPSSLSGSLCISAMIKVGGQWWRAGSGEGRMKGKKKENRKGQKDFGRNVEKNAGRTREGI